MSYGEMPAIILLIATTYLLVVYLVLALARRTGKVTATPSRNIH
jgi:hypothetical protein